MGDALQGVGNVSNRQWDGIWTGKAAKQHRLDGARVGSVPHLNFNPGSEAGINFQRTIRRRTKKPSGWAGPGTRASAMTNAGLLTGILGVTQGAASTSPYVVATSLSPGRSDSHVATKAMSA